MNSASNMIAKWYQKAWNASPPRNPEKICEMPTASVGAPPVRAISVSSCTASAAAWSCSGVMTKPRLETASAADWTVVPTTPAGEFIAKYRPGLRMDAAAMAMTATNDSISMEP